MEIKKSLSADLEGKKGIILRVNTRMNGLCLGSFGHVCRIRVDTA